MGHYDVGQVCLNGHEITGNYHQGSEFAEKYCSKCGAETITKCPNCGTSIRGYYDHEGGVLAVPEFDIPSYCHNCGTGFPWTERAISAAQQLTAEIDGLSAEERHQANESFRELTKDTPQTEVAVVRVKKLIAKAGPAIGSGLKQVLVSVATEAVKKQLGL